MDPVTRVRSAARSLFEKLRQEDGFTLSELLSAQIIGGFVLASAASLLMIAFNSSTRITDRVNSAAQGRVAMEEIQQRLRSQTCLFPNEYAISPATQSTSASISFLHASAEKIVFFTDIGASGGGTGTTTGVGFSPQLRYIYVDPGPTTGTNAGRLSKFVDGTRLPSNSAIPYLFNLNGQGPTNMATVVGANAAPPTAMRAFADGITSDVSGVTATPIFRFFDINGAQIVATTSSPVPQAQLASITDVRVRFRVLSASGKDQAAGATAGSGVDDRTTVFDNEIFLKTPQNACQ
jgi:hypothetical protein